MNIVENFIVVSAGESPDAAALERLSWDVLGQIRRQGAKGVVLNVSGICFVDSYSFSLLRKLAKAASMLGARFVFVGFQPGVASTVVDLGLDLQGLNTVRTMEDALELLRGVSGVRPSETEQPEADYDDARIGEMSSDVEGATCSDSGV